MYHSTILIELIGDGPMAEAASKVEPLEGFVHKISSTTWEDLLARLEALDASNNPDHMPTLVMAQVRTENDLRQLEKVLGQLSVLKTVLANTQRPYDQADISPLHDTEIIALITPELFNQLGPECDDLTDAWILPIDKQEALFRIRKWQHRFEQRANAWQTSQYLEATLNSTPSLVWYKTADGIHKKVNRSFCLTVDKPKSDIEGKGHAYIWDVENDDPACIESERRTMETRSTCVTEEAVQAGNDVKLLTTYKSPLYDLDGSVMGTVGIGIDVTQERMYRDNLIKKNDDLEAIFSAMECGVLVHSLDGSRVLEINQAALDILGYNTVDDMIGAGFDMFAASVLPEDAEKMREKLKELKEVGDSVSMSYRTQHDDGAIIHVIGNIKLIERNGELLYQRFLLDDSERQHAEERREKRQQALLQTLSERYTAVFVMDVTTGAGEILRLSKDLKGRAENRIFELESVNKALEDYVDKLVAEDDKESVLQAIKRENILEQLNDQQRYTVLYRAKSWEEIENAIEEGTLEEIDPDELYEYRQITVAKAGSWAGNTKYAVIGFRNVDAETRAEMEQKALLEAARDAAERANQAKSAFLSSMSHDIRTPMNAVIGFTDLARAHVDDPQAVEGYLDKISTSSTHLLNLINDILDMSRIESGNVALDKRPCDMKEILDGLISIMEPEAERRELSLKLITEGDIDIPILADKLKVDQIMLNLLGNAVKFTPAGGAVEVGCKRISAPSTSEATYRLTVKDNGIGMAQDFLERIFDAFAREQTSTVSGIEGTGLGMAITKNLVDMMGGTIRVASKKDVGTCFTVELTFDKASEDEAKLIGTSPHAHSIHYDKLSGTRVLLVEDNMLNREIATAILQGADLEVECAVNGQDAIDKLVEAEPGHFQVVLMDIQMPVLDGYEATERIRQLDDSAKANVPILALTANAFEEDRKHALDAGMNGHVTKPININELFEVMEDVLD